MPKWYYLENAAYPLKGKEKVKKLEEALSAAKEFKQADGYPQSQVLLTLGIVHKDNNQLVEAARCFKESISIKEKGMKVSLAGKSNPDTISGVYLPAYSNKEAEQSNKMHNLANTHYWLGITLLAQHKNQEAVETLAKAITLMDQNPNPETEAILLPKTLTPYAKALRSVGRKAEAQKAEARADEANKKNRRLLDR